MNPDDRAELVGQALAILGDRQALPELLELVEGYRDALERECRQARWAEMRDRLEDFEAAARLLESTARTLPAVLECFGYDPKGTISPVLSGTNFAHALRRHLKKDMDAIEAQYCRGGAKRPRREPPAKLRMAEAARALLEQYRPGVVSSTRSGTFHRFIIVVHQIATGSDDEGRLTGALAKVAGTQNRFENL